MTEAPRAAPEGRFQVDAVTWLLLYLVVLYAIPSRLVIPALGSAGAPSMVLGLLSLLGWGLYQLSRSRASDELHAFPVRRASVFFVICVCISYVVAMTRPIDGDEVSPADVALLSVLSWSGTLLVANDLTPSLGRLRRLVHGLVWAGGLVGLLGLIQFVTGDVVIDRVAIPGLTSVEFESFERGGFVRPSGTATHPIEFGIILAMVLPFALHMAYEGAGRSRLMRWAPAVILGVSIALTFSRSAYVSFVVGLLVLIVGWPTRRRLTFGIGILVVASLLFAAVPRLFGTINSLFRNVSNDPSISSRTGSYDLAFEFIAKAPLFGRGLGTFLPKYRIFDNQYLLLLVSVGLVGTLAVLWLFASGIRAALAARAGANDPIARDLGLSAAASVAAGAVSLTAFDAFAFPMAMGTLFLVLGVAGALHRLTGRSLVAPGLLDSVMTPQSGPRRGGHGVRGGADGHSHRS